MVRELASHRYQPNAFVFGLKHFVLIFFTLFFSLAAFAINGRTTYQAKIIKPDGFPLEAVNVNFKFSVLDTVGACVIYSETYSAINMASTGGLISFALGGGTRTFPVASATTAIFSNVFDNSIISMPCEAAGIYNPGPNDTRKIVMQFNDGAGWQTLPAMTINAVPYAMYAGKSENSILLNGKADTAFVENSTLAALNCNPTTHAITFNGASFSCIAIGSGGGGITSVTTSGTVLQTGGTASAPVISITAASISADGYLTSLDYAEFKAKLSASSTQIADTLGFAPVSGAAVVSEVATQISQAGSSANVVDTLVRRNSSGNITVNDLYANAAKVNYVDIYRPSTAFNIRLQAPTSLASSYVLNLPTSSGTTGQVLSTDGSGNLSWVSPTTGSVVSVSATAPLASTGGSNPTISISQATTSTDGYLSSADWNTFNSKLTSSSAAISAALGYTPANSATVAATYVNKSGDTMTGPLTLSTITSGSLLFAGAGGLVSENNSQLFWNNTDSRLGVGTAVPTAKLHIYDSGVPLALFERSTSTNAVVQYKNTSGSVYAGLNTNGAFAIGAAPNLALNPILAATVANGIDIQNGTAGLPATSGTLQNSSLRINPSGNPTVDMGFNTTGVFAGWIQATLKSNLATNYALLLNPNGGNVGIGTTTPTAKLELAAGTSSLAPLKFTSGTLTTTPQSGTIEYDGSQLYYTDGTNTRRALASNSGNQSNSANNTYSGVNTFSGQTYVSNNTASTNSTTGALIVSGGVGIGGALNVAGNTNVSGSITSSSNIQGVSLTATSGMITPYIYGSTTASGSLTLESTTNASKGNIILAPNGGNVGIGTTMPTSTLQVTAGGNIAGAGGEVGFSARSGYLPMASIKGLLTYSTGSEDQGGLGFFTRPQNVSSGQVLTERMRILSGGYVGIGTTNPGRLLTNTDNTVSYYNVGDSSSIGQNSNSLSWSVSGAGYVASFVNAASGSTANGIQIRTAGVGNQNILALGTGITSGTNANDVMVVKASGNVGVGIATPQVKFHVLTGGLSSATATSGLGEMVLERNTDTGFAILTPSTAIGSIAFGDEQNGSIGRIRYLHSTDAMTFQTSGSEAMRIAGNGNVSIGQANPSEKLSVSGHIILTNPGPLTDRRIALTVNGGGEKAYLRFDQTASPGPQAYWDLGSLSANNTYDFGFESSGTRRMTLTFGGNLGVGVTTPTAKLHLASGTSFLAPLKFASGTLLASPQSGTIEYDGLQLYYTDGTNTRRALASNSGNQSNSANNTYSGVNTFNGQTYVSNNTSSTNSTTGALVVSGGVGIGGALNVAGNTNVSGSIISSGNIQGVSLTATSGMITPYIYGSTAVSGSLTLESTTNATKGHILLAPNGGNIGIGTIQPLYPLDVVTASTQASLGIRATGGNNSAIYMFTLNGNPTESLGSSNISGGNKGWVFSARSNSNGTIPNTLGFQFWNGTAWSYGPYIDQTGSVGIGTQAPSSKLHLVVSDGATALRAEGGTGAQSESVYVALQERARFGYDGSRSAVVLDDRNSSGTTTGKRIAFDTAGSEKMRIETSGNVGIGTAAPTVPLDIGIAVSNTRTSILARGADNNFQLGAANGVQTNVSGDITTKFGLTYSGSENALINFHRGDSNVGGFLSFSTNNGTERMRIDGQGKVGIGTTAPTSLLTLASNGGPIPAPPTDSLLHLANADSVRTSVQLDSFNAPNAFQFRRANGTASAPTALQANDTIGSFNFTGYGSTAYHSTARAAIVVKAAENWTDSATGTYQAFITNPISSTASVERLRIDSTGNIGIGTTTPQALLDVSGTAFTNKLLIGNSRALGAFDNPIDFGNVPAQIKFTAHVNDAADIYSTVSGTITGLVLNVDDDTADYIEMRTAGSSRLYVGGNGNVGIGTTNPGYKLDVSGTINIASGSALTFGGTNVCTAAGCTSSSDERLKENIKPLDFNLNKLLSLTAVQYDWKDKSKYGDQHQIGFIAQDLEQVFPEVVYTDKNTGLKSVTYGHLVAPVIEALKSIYNRIVGVESELVEQRRQLASIVESKANTDAKIKQLEAKAAELDAVKAENAELKAYLCSKDPSAPICK